ncbi:MAG: hypothetical protein ACRDT4_26960, partial [Micromonosporaceae bacterium]
MTVHRIREHAGLWAMLAALVAVAAFLVTAAPRVVSRTEDAALRQAIAESPSSVRDLTVVTDLANPGVGSLADERDSIADRLPPILRRAVQQRWYAVQAAPGTGIADYFPDFEGVKPKLDVRIQDGFAGAVTLVDGELPGAPQLPPAGADALSVEAVVSAETAAALRLRVGSTFEILGERHSSPPLQVRISGVFRANDPAEPIWQDHPQSLHPGIPRPLSSDPPTYLGTALLHPEAVGALAAIGWGSEVTFRHRLDERRLHAGQTGALATALGQLATGAHGVPEAYLDTGLDHLVTQFQARRGAVAAVVAVVLAGLLGALLGVLLLGVRLAAERRREELRLWRARGASLPTVAGTLAAECALPVLPAALLGWGLAMAYPSRAGDLAWPVLAIAAVAIGGLPW